MPEAIYRQNPGQQDVAAGTARAAGEIVQLADGRAAVIKAVISATEKGAQYTAGIFDFLCATGTTWSEGTAIWWSPSTSLALTAPALEADFYLGTQVGGKAGAETIVRGDLNVGTGSGGGDIFIDVQGDDTYGNGTAQQPFASLTAAVAAVTATRKNIFAGAGEFEEAGAVVWPTISGVKLFGAGGNYQTVISAAAGDEVISVAPGAQDSTFEMWIENIYIDHTTTGQDGLKLDNTSMTKKLNCYLKNFGADAKTDSDKSITVTHGDTSNAVRIYAGGDNGGIEGAIYFETKDGGDRLHLRDMDLNGGIEFSTDAIAVQLRLTRCRVKADGITGGSTSGVVICAYCDSKTGDTFALLDTDDVAGNFTGEQIYPTS